MLILIIVTLAAAYLVRHIYLQFQIKKSCASGCGKSCTATKIDWDKIQEEQSA